MCGIIGYIGRKDPVPMLLKGLKNLEYRGYDSAGVALLNEKTLQVIKEQGKIKNLEEKIANTKTISSHLGIAHTRWATHGVPSLENAHPHTVRNITIVHNGIIENMQELKNELLKEGYTFQTDTDTEVIAALLDAYDEGDIVSSIQKSCEAVRGSYALGILKKGDSNHLYAVRKNSPLVIGLSEDGIYIASDIGAISTFVKKYIELPNDVIAMLTESTAKFIDFEGNQLKLEEKAISTEEVEPSKMGYDHYMLKEMMEEPFLIDRMLKSLVDSKETLFEKLPDIHSFEEIHIVACGSALYAGMIGKYLLEEYGKIRVTVEVASEYRYQNTIYDRKTLVIFISQSGETADTLASFYKAKEEGLTTLGIVNVKTSTLAKEVDIPLLIEAGREVAVATTKAYILQVFMLVLLALKVAYQKENISEEELTTILEELHDLPSKVEVLLHQNYHSLAQEIYKSEDVFFIGRGIDYAICLEGSLKLKEVSYIHSEAYQAGELKHGTISLIKEGMPVIAVITNDSLKEKTLSNLKETEARGAKTIVITTEEVGKDAQWIIKVDGGSDFVKPLLIVPILQLLSYEVAKLRGCEIDQPKNLAKSVTVE